MKSKEREKEGKVFPLHKKLHLARTVAGLSQAELARKVNRDNTLICYFETGRREPSDRNLQEIAKACGVPVDFLLDDKKALKLVCVDDLPPDVVEAVEATRKRGRPGVDRVRQAAFQRFVYRCEHRPVRVAKSARQGGRRYYYCGSCGWEMVLPKDHACAVPELCHECVFLKRLGWLQGRGFVEERRVRVQPASAVEPSPEEQVAKAEVHESCEPLQGHHSSGEPS